MNDLKSIGYNDWYESRADVKKIISHDVARVASVNKGSYTVTKGGESIFRDR